jgi:hypothetical protein
MKHALLAGLALIGAALLAGGCAGSRHATSLPGLTPTRLVRIEAMVRTTATADGDAHPSRATVFASRRHEANIAAGAGTGVPGRQPVYLVVIRGHFVCSGCTAPGRPCSSARRRHHHRAVAQDAAGPRLRHRRGCGHEQGRSRPAARARSHLTCGRYSAFCGGKSPRWPTCSTWPPGRTTNSQEWCCVRWGEPE